MRYNSSSSQAFKQAREWVWLCYHLIEDLYLALTSLGCVEMGVLVLVCYLMMVGMSVSFHLPVWTWAVAALVIVIWALATFMWLGYRVHKKWCEWQQQDGGVVVMYREPVCNDEVFEQERDVEELS